MRIKVEVDGSAVDIPTMRDMSVSEYRAYIEDELFFVDHHDVLRSAMGEYPLAVTCEQLQALVAYLQNLEPKVGAAEEGVMRHEDFSYE